MLLRRRSINQASRFILSRAGHAPSSASPRMRGRRSHGRLPLRRRPVSRSHASSAAGAVSRSPSVRLIRRPRFVTQHASQQLQQRALCASDDKEPSLDVNVSPRRWWGDVGLLPWKHRTSICEGFLMGTHTHTHTGLSVLVRRRRPRPSHRAEDQRNQNTELIQNNPAHSGRPEF